MKGILGLEEKKMEHKMIVQEVCEKIDKEIVQVANQGLKKKQVKKVLEKIVELKKWADKIPILQSKIDEKMSGILVQAKKENLTGEIVREVQKITENPQEGDKNVVVFKELMFKYSKQLSIPRILPILRMTITDAIQKFTGETDKAINKVQLKRIYDIYEEEYKNQQMKHVAQGNAGLIEENLLQVRDRIYFLIKSIENNSSNPKIIRQTIPKTLANIFIFWSIRKSGQSYYEAKEMKKEADSYLLQPHPIQVLSILRFIGCDDEENLVSRIIGGIGFNISKLDNHIMQIKTGEGKSVFLGSMAILLALMGHKVDCVCYSAYLSERDFEDFQSIFRELGVIDLISYGTFGSISQKIINEQCDIRTVADNIFMPKLAKKKETKSGKYVSRVLLVDEVDTFFSRDFYGQTYNPVTLLRNKQIDEIIDTIWKNKDLSPTDIQSRYSSSSAYKTLQTQYKDCIDRIKTQLFNMAKDVKLYNSRDYVTQNGRIGYKELDGISFNSVYGYQTMFAYYYESQPERGNVTKEVLYQYKGITITCGQYSYAEIINSFDKIFGVTGTLSSLSKFEQQILKRYKINKKTYAPSVYGNSLRKQGPILIQPDKSSQYQTIATKIQQDLKDKRATLVFFENQNELQDFKNSEYASRFADKTKVVTQKTLNRSHFIKKATASDTVTLFTAPFGRGTDFVIFDPVVEKQGLNVIQTFLSEEESQQIQMKGRTARQGKQGTYQLILNLLKLESKYKITSAMIKKASEDATSSVGKVLHQNRVKYLEQVNKERQKEVDRAKAIHISSTEMKQKMLDNKISRNEEFFFKNCTSSVGSKARISILIDATGSMTPTLNQAKGKVMDMIDNMAKKYPGQFEIQLMFYYGYNAYSSQQNGSSGWGYYNKIHHTEWTSDTNLLRKFMSTVGPSGGTGQEAVEVAMHHLLLSFGEIGVTKAILIGDAAYSSNQSTPKPYHVHQLDKYRYKGRQSTNIVEQLLIHNLLSALKSSGVSIDSYPIGGSRCQTTFQHISTTTGGKCKPFNPNTDNLSAEIETTITECIVMRK